MYAEKTDMEIKTAHKNSSQFGSRRFVAAVSFSLHTHLLTCDCAGCTIVAISPIFILPQENFPRKIMFNDFSMKLAWR